MPDKPRRILVTSALPYANGSIHIGHLVEYIQTDIWVRFQKLHGHQCHYVCADDTHGTPVMLRAEQEGITPEALIERMQREHLGDFTAFHVAFDNYHSTNSEENRMLSQEIYRRLRARGLIEARTIEQFYDPVREMFLPDRYIKGGCPRCRAPEQYGDACEQCGATYAPTDLVDPVSVISGATPVREQSEHYFFRLGECREFLETWLRVGREGGDGSSPLQPETRHKLAEWFEAGLRDWDISRDAPYFGFEIPDAPDKYLYVWLDAPVGYMASFLNLCERDGLDFDDWWKPDSRTELCHFIGKDILYFHALFWPAILHHAGYRTPDRIFVHGFLTVNGQKMSKSRGTFITARSFLNHLNPEYLRYYFAAKLNDRVEDLDLNFDDFCARINSDLVGKFVNIASRCAGFIHSHFDGRLAADIEAGDRALLARLQQAADPIARAWDERRYSEAVRQIMDLADAVNAWINEQQPWRRIKADGERARVQQICTTALNAFRLLALYLKPVLPGLAAEIEEFLDFAAPRWDSHAELMLGRPIKPYRHLATRVEARQIEALIGENRTHAAPAAVTTPARTARKGAKRSTEHPDIPGEITIEDFARIDLRVARVVEARDVEGADKLLELVLDIGDGETRRVFAGIRTRYAAQSLVGRHVVVVANLAPRRMRFGVSEGMVLAAGPGGDELWLIGPDDGARPGLRVK
jgi:methionyl-tRNA synthetase